MSGNCFVFRLWNPLHDWSVGERKVLVGKGAITWLAELEKIKLMMAVKEMCINHDFSLVTDFGVEGVEIKNKSTEFFRRS